MQRFFVLFPAVYQEEAINRFSKLYQHRPLAGSTVEFAGDTISVIHLGQDFIDVFLENVLQAIGHERNENICAGVAKLDIDDALTISETSREEFIKTSHAFFEQVLAQLDATGALVTYVQGRRSAEELMSTLLDSASDELSELEKHMMDKDVHPPHGTLQ